MTTVELLPCPFCGGTLLGRQKGERRTDGTAGEPAKIICGDCNARIFAYSLDKATAAWNRRPSAAPLPNPEADQLRGVFAEMGTTAADPMWADHVELPKAVLRHWIKTLRPAVSTLSALGEALSDLDAVERKIMAAHKSGGDVSVFEDELGEATAIVLKVYRALTRPEPAQDAGVKL